jgi:hypothetical protein
MNKSGPSSGFPGQSVTLRFDDAETFQGVVGYVCQGGNYMPYGGYTWEGNADHFTVNINLPCDDVSQQIKLSINGEDFYVDITRPHSAAAFTKLSDDIISGRRVQQWKVLCYCLDGNTANFTLDYTPAENCSLDSQGIFLENYEFQVSGPIDAVDLGYMGLVCSCCPGESEVPPLVLLA